jgi:N-acetyl-alpha-D-glucosaminyl L-malate synthase BshA
MRIAMLAHGPTGGSGVVARELSNMLAASGHSVTLFSTSASRARLIDAVRLVAVEAPDYPVLPSPAHTLAMTTALLHFLQNNQVDLVHVHYALPWAMAAWSATTLHGGNVPFIVTFHGTDVTGIGASDAYLGGLRAACQRAARWTTPSKSLAIDAKTLYGVPHVLDIPNFVDGEVYQPSEGQSATRRGLGLDERRFHLVHVSNFRPVKRAERLVPILRGLVDAGVDAHLSLVGDGPTLQDVVQGVTDAGVAHRLTVAPDADDTLPWTQAADALLLTSDRESFGLVALEAMACGRVVVASDVDGLREVINDGVDGYLRAPDDIQAWVDTLATVSRDQTLARRIGEAGRVRANEVFSPEAALKRYSALYAEVTGG